MPPPPTRPLLPRAAMAMPTPANAPRSTLPPPGSSSAQRTATARPAIGPTGAPGPTIRSSTPQSTRAASGAAGTIGGVIEAVKLVDEVLIEENDVLRRHDARGAALLQDRKQAATRLYMERMRVLIKDVNSAKKISPEQRLQLGQMARGLDQHVRDNAILLKATMDSIDRLFGAINVAAQKKSKRDLSYSRRGLVADAASAHAASIAFNRNV
jgi:hypothetical protein